MVERNDTDGAQWLAVGTHIYLQSDVPDCKDRYEVMVHGWQEGRFILTDMPSEEGAAETFKVGTGWVARCVLSGKAFGFKMEVGRIQFDPKPLIFFRYPDSVEAKRIREFRRIATFIIGSLSHLSEEGEPSGKVECVIRDLSRGGCLVDVNESLLPGEKVSVNFVLPNGEPLENIPAVVRNVRRSGDKHFEGGVMFSEEAEQKRVVDSFFEHVPDNEH